MVTHGKFNLGNQVKFNKGAITQSNFYGNKFYQGIITYQKDTVIRINYMKYLILCISIS